MEAEVDNDVGENAYDGDCSKSLTATSPSNQFPFFSIIANQLANKAKDSLEDKKKKGLGGSNKMKNSCSLRRGNLR
jgi:hypothetical protein